ncbi:MAG: hypothetical protein KAJ03_00405 [Gammaproteobacteria bacterium]|nr:hypothetical protein [Gammaproteobacteria bacterium]
MALRGIKVSRRGVSLLLTKAVKKAAPKIALAEAEPIAKNYLRNANNFYRAMQEGLIQATDQGAPNPASPGTRTLHLKHPISGELTVRLRSWRHGLRQSYLNRKRNTKGNNKAWVRGGNLGKNIKREFSTPRKARSIPASVSKTTQRSTHIRVPIIFNKIGNESLDQIIHQAFVTGKFVQLTKVLPFSRGSKGRGLNKINLLESAALKNHKTHSRLYRPMLSSIAATYGAELRKRLQKL